MGGGYGPLLAANSALDQVFEGAGIGAAMTDDAAESVCGECALRGSIARRASQTPHQLLCGAGPFPGGRGLAKVQAKDKTGEEQP